MKIGMTSALLLAGWIVLAVFAVPVHAAETSVEDFVQTESSDGRSNVDGGSGVAAAIMCGGFSRMAVSTGMNPGIASAAIAACAYMMLDGFFDFPW
jgi:hypothetical protein